MDTNEIKKLLKIFDTSTATELVIDESGNGGARIKISKNVNIISGGGTLPATAGIPSQLSQMMPAVQTTSDAEETKTNTSQDVPLKNENLYEVKSPMVGTFYRSPAPDADAYVKVGDSISQGTVLCIIEAMKLMNEIESDVSGKIVKILVENATAVEYGQPLFLIEQN
ncbi:MAG TPA: acetyl-CoA carboxylase biotin carboxyl carrier protein [Ignavibacteria bacterium]|nr:acetyl-CoA carboxylase biotin carboxyl carrier protein [Ignavibacteria bacterium]